MSKAMHQGFTLIELLVVISIIAIMAAMLMPALNIVRQSANTAVCASNQRQIMLGTFLYGNDNEAQIPLSHDWSGSWWYKTSNLGQYLDIISPGSGSIATFQGAWRLLKCPENRQAPTGGSYGFTSRYSCDTQDQTPASSGIPTNSPLLFHQLHNTSVVMFATDVSGDGRMYVYTPLILFGGGNVDQLASWSGGITLQPTMPTPRHRKGINCAFLDGHVRWSPNLVIEDNAKTLYVRRDAAVF